MVDNKEKETKEQEYNQSEVPKAFQDKQVKTKVTSLRVKIEDTLQMIKERVTLEVKMPVFTRMRKRMAEIKAQASAKTMRVQGHHYTTPPKFHILNLQGNKLSNDLAEITFSVYDQDDAGNKKPTYNEVEVEREDGTKFTRKHSAEYRIAYEVKETIQLNKPLEREIMKFDTPGNPEKTE